MSTFVDRMKVEREELAAKIVAATSFLHSGEGVQLHEEEATDLLHQLTYMLDYHAALVKRIRFYSAKQGDS